METFFSANSAENYYCKNCDTKCSKKNDWLRHLKCTKHLRNTGTKMEVEKSAAEIRCNCGKLYNTKSGLWKHKKICLYKPAKTQFLKNEPIKVNEPIKLNELYTKNEPIINDISFLTNMVLEVVKNNAELQKQTNEYQKQNQEFQKEMLNLYKTVNTITNTHNHTNNSNNKTFNLQLFLNEQCKDAMNLMDFVNSMTLELSDLEDVGKLGYVEGISNIIIRNLNALDVHKRPIHCSDGKREIMYVKEDNVWEKETSTNDRLRKAIKRVTYKNSAMLVPWSQKYPACMNNQHQLNDVYVKMMGQAMGGKESFMDSENKIMKKIAKAVLIEKI
jgi:hypothetical protein